MQNRMRVGYQGEGILQPGVGVKSWGGGSEELAITRPLYITIGTMATMCAGVYRTCTRDTRARLVGIIR